MKSSFVAGTCILQLLCLLTLNIRFSFGVYFTATIMALTIILGTVFLFKKNLSPETKNLGKGLLLGTLITLFLLFTFIFWISISFSR